MVGDHSTDKILAKKHNEYLQGIPSFKGIDVIGWHLTILNDPNYICLLTDVVG